MIEIMLEGGLRDGETFEVEFVTPTVKAPGAYEDSVVVWNKDRYVRSFPTEVYRRDRDRPGTYVYDHTEPGVGVTQK